MKMEMKAHFQGSTCAKRRGETIRVGMWRTHNSNEGSDSKGERENTAECCALGHVQIMCQILILRPKYSNSKGGTGKKKTVKSVLFFQFSLNMCF